MNPHLETILDLIRQSQKLTDSEKNIILRSAQQADDELQQKNCDLEIETSLERIRAVALNIRKPDDLLKICEIIFSELNKLGFKEIRNAMVNIHDDATASLLNYDFSDVTGPTVTNFPYDSHPVTENLVKQIKKKNDAFGEFVISGNELNDWRSYRKSMGEEDDMRLQDISAVYYYFYSIGPGALGISAFKALPAEKLNILQRFRNVFSLLYQRYNDIKLAETQTREAKIEAALERVRSKAMSMHRSDDLNAAVAIVFEELGKLNLEMLRCGIGILKNDNRCADVWSTTIGDEGIVVQVSGDESLDIHPLLQGAYNAWVQQSEFSYLLEGEDMSEYYKAVSATNFKLPQSQSKIVHDKDLRQYYYACAFQSGNLFAFRSGAFSDEAKAVMKRFAGVFDLTYKRFLDIQNAENQARISDAQKRVIEEKHREITENINYALRIQSAILPSEKLVKDFLKQSFVLYIPKDVVAGDFYWMVRVHDMILFSVCDCTGHGVSGAMVSVICHNALNTAVREYNITQPSVILDKVAELVEENFMQSENQIQDGMDASICAYYPLQQKLQWAGANNPLWIVRNNELLEYKPDKQPIGKYENRKPYTNHEINLQKGDCIYIFSDGYQDQFGGADGRKLMKKGLKNILLSLSEKKMEAKYNALLNYHYEWKGKEEQVDDICIMGVEI
jgi:serine phosphatase RsbU (regulator of sigma subunit)